jgi:hypothetical protein
MMFRKLHLFPSTSENVGGTYYVVFVKKYVRLYLSDGSKIVGAADPNSLRRKQLQFLKCCVLKNTRRRTKYKSSAI